MRAGTEIIYEVGAFNAGDTEFRVVERSADRVFDVVRCAPEEPVELLAECPYSFRSSPRVIPQPVTGSLGTGNRTGWRELPFSNPLRCAGCLVHAGMIA